MSLPMDTLPWLFRTKCDLTLSQAFFRLSDPDLTMYSLRTETLAFSANPLPRLRILMGQVTLLFCFLPF